jgi:hypothetical protein
MSQLEALANIISGGVRDIQSALAARNASYPTPQDVCDPATDAIQNEFSSQTAPIIAAAYQLIATLSHPQPYLLGMGLWVRVLPVS